MDCNTAGTVTLIGIVLVVIFAAFTSGLFDDALDIVVRDIVGFRFGDQYLQGRVICWGRRRPS